MSRAGLARLWAILGGLLAIYSIGTLIILQGGKSFVDIPGLEAKSPVTSAYLAVPIIGSLLGILAAVGLLYLRTERPEGEGLFPIVAIADVGPHRTSSLSMMSYQGFFLLVFLLLPAASLLRLNFVVLQRGILWHDGDPALGSITLKNAFSWTKGAGDVDANEFMCSSRVMRDEGFTWLANMRCDLVKDNRLRPFNKDGKSMRDDADAARAQTCTRDLAVAQSRNQSCDGARDISEECETAERHCRGVQWLPVISPLLIIFTTFFGLIMLTWLLIEAISGKVNSRRGVANKFEPVDTIDC